MKLTEFDYKLPKELIAQYPFQERAKSRLLVLDRKTSKVYDRIFEDIIEYINEGDALVLNDTKVIPARLLGKRKTGAKVEIFLLERKNPVSEALVRPSKRLKAGEKIILESGNMVEILNRGNIGRFVKFNHPLDEVLVRCGHTPLPPYVNRADEESDKEDYQTVYARHLGATASPTAGLHFTKALLQRIEDRSVKVAYVTLHTSYGTFAPVKEENIEEHKMHAEYFNMPKETAKVIDETKKKGGRIFAVGTTATRVLEHCFKTNHEPPSYAKASPFAKATGDKSKGRRTTNDVNGYTNLFIYPSYKFRIVDCLITNFHLPKSTLLMLVCAFAGKDFIFKAYNHAINEKYRFYSYGDAMLIL